MNRRGTLATAALLAGSSCLPHVFVRDGGAAACDDAATTPAPDFCTAVPALANAPVLDGVPECGLVLAPLPTSLTYPASFPSPAGIAVAYAVAWRPDGLYVFVRVHTGRDAITAPAGESRLYCYDAVELYVDDDGTFAHAPDYDHPGTAQFVVEAPPPGVATASAGIALPHLPDAGSPIAPWTSSRFVARTTSGGYDVEALITGADLGLTGWSLAAGHRVGLDLAVDVGRPSGSTTGLMCNPTDNTRAAEIVLRVAPTDVAPPDQSVAAFCTPSLGAP